MLDKFKDLGAQVINKTGDAVGTITTSVKGGMESLSSAAGSMTDSINEKAIRASTAEACTILQIALEELKNKPLSNRRVSLTASVNFGVAALEMQVHVDPADRADQAIAPASESHV